MQATEEVLTTGTEADLTDFFGRTALHYAAGAGHSPVVRVLLVAGAKADARDRSGVTPLHDAVLGSHAETVALLLAAGVDPLGWESASADTLSPYLLAKRSVTRPVQAGPGPATDYRPSAQRR